MRWLRKSLGLERRSEDLPAMGDAFAEHRARQARMEQAATVDDGHYTNHVEQVKQLKREKRHSEAIELLHKLIQATEAESKAAGPGWGVAPWYYEQLAIVYRKEKLFDEEVAILERYAGQPKAPGAQPGRLAERLTKAREIAAGSKA